MIELINELRGHKKDFSEIDNVLDKSFIDYYRYVIRKEDRDVIRKLTKIPDDWGNYVDNSDVLLTETVKGRLSDVKKRMSWEMKIQSLYLASISSIERSLQNYFLYKKMESSEIDDAVNSINYIMMELDNYFINIKHLILSLAKRSISDCYYLMSAYTRYKLKRNFVYEKDMKTLLIISINALKSYSDVDNYVDKFNYYNEKISPLFITSSNKLGWRLNESEAKTFFEENNSMVLAMDLYKVAREAFKFKNNIKDRYMFMKYYYNDNDGKEFRLKFIKESLKNKVAEKKIDESVFDKFNRIYENFKKYKIQFEVTGLQGYGPNQFFYMEILEFLYKISKVVEFYYLRNMQYDNLKVFRDEIQCYVEKELFSFIL